MRGIQESWLRWAQRKEGDCSMHAYLESLYGRGAGAVDVEQLNFFWEGTLPFATMNGDFLGPSTAQARHLYQNLRYDDCEAAIKECGEVRHSGRRG